MRLLDLNHCFKIHEWDADVFELAGATLTPLNFIMNFTVEQKEHEIYLHDDFTVSLFMPAPSDYYFKHFSLN